MKKVLLLLAGLTLAACQSTPPPSPPPTQPPAPQTAPQPGVIVPAPLPPRGANAGPLKPEGVSRYMDMMERSLRATFPGNTVRIARRGESLFLAIPNSQLFAGESLSPSGAALVASLARALGYYDHTIGQVNGYTDTAGQMAQNLVLSQARAALVDDVLVTGGVTEGRFTAHGFGQDNLKVVTGDHVSEPRNRRIEINIVPKPD